MQQSGKHITTEDAELVLNVKTFFMIPPFVNHNIKSNAYFMEFEAFK